MTLDTHTKKTLIKLVLEASIKDLEIQYREKVSVLKGHLERLNNSEDKDFDKYLKDMNEDLKQRNKN